MKLLQILGPQLELLVNKGQPNLHAIYDALCQEKLVSQQELQELRVTFALDSDPMPKGSLDTAVRGLIRDVSSRVLGKRKFEDIDAVTVNKIPVSCDIFEKLRNGRWLNDDIINLAMNISDKPSFVKHGYSVPLDEVGKTRTTKPIEKPLAAWARRIDRLRKQARDIFGDTIHPVYFCPLNHNNNHFTLLEVNDREKVIRHYDSMADQTITEGRFTLTRVAQLVEEEFADLGYAYSEAPTPQQTDGWSCGIRVVWNFTRLSNGLPIGGWDAVLEPERMIMELVEGLRACVETNAMGKYTEDPSESSSDSENRSKKARNLSPPGHPQRKTSRKATNRDSR
ncbi:uncharacterized protein A1O5_12660 [Cladophialophora psammophila CBS 110553]|uniref:Ubiquitin-like protease family profile domain-containing protein n=1 Tax=Cladophialophora psammophila CBS 110553 TaxID=1182543 RepID=W9WCF8_9EURO|nr:uncharacterized protein A1O5_12660 [Cladophialophora psammophila CBS 110553]EXJ56204.1 hypothetical protein A1O5_12660 [Cladophialophora psammophila CBS 110553]